jgi:hypothetical protein
MFKVPTPHLLFSVLLGALINFPGWATVVRMDFSLGDPAAKVRMVYPGGCTLSKTESARAYYAVDFVALLLCLLALQRTQRRNYLR